MPSLLATFTQHLDLSSTQLETLLAKPLTECLDSPEVQRDLSSLDTHLLQETLPTAGSILAKELPPFYNWLTQELKVQRVPDSPDHTTKWVIGFVNNQESLTNLVELHRPVSSFALEQAIPRLVEMFAGVEDAQIRHEWQKAVATLCLVLAVAAREREALSAI